MIRWGQGRRTRTTAGPDLARALRACLRDAPGPSSTANGRHHQQPANMKLGQALNPRATHENTLVMRRSSRDLQDDLGGPVVPSVNDAGKSGAGQRVTYLLKIAGAKAERFGDRPERRRLSLTAFSRTGRTAPGHGAARCYLRG